MMFTTPETASEPYVAEAPSDRTSMRSTAEIGITLTSTKLAPPLASTGEMLARRPLISTRVARLRNETWEPPLVEPEEMLPFSEPILFEP